MLTTKLVTDANELNECQDDWDRLACENERPFCAPAVMLAWWKHLQPDDAELRVIAIEDGGRLVGLLPLFGGRGRYGLLGEAFGLVEPLAQPGRADEVANALGAALAAIEPSLRSLRLEWQHSAPNWPDLLSEAWHPETAALHSNGETALPLIQIDDGFDGWLASRSKRFRQEVRRRGRRLEEIGARFRISDQATVDRDIEELIRLHGLRFGGGQSDLTDPRVTATLKEIAGALLARDRFRLVTLECDGTTIAAQLMLGAGRRVTGLVGGFDDSFGKYQPAIQCIVHALQDMDARGERTLVLGPGDQTYKRVLSTGTERLGGATLLPPGLTGKLELGRVATASRIGSLTGKARARLGALRRQPLPLPGGNRQSEFW